MRHCPCRPFVLQEEKASFLSEFLPCKQAARVLGLSTFQAFAFMIAHPELCASVRVIAGGKVHEIWCIVVRDLRWHIAAQIDLTLDDQ